MPQFRKIVYFSKLIYSFMVYLLDQGLNKDKLERKVKS